MYSWKSGAVAADREGLLGRGMGCGERVLLLNGKGVRGTFQFLQRAFRK